MSSGIAILPTSCSAAARRRWATSPSSRPRRRPTCSARRATSSTWSRSAPSCSPTTLRRTWWTVSSLVSAPAALVRVHPLVGEAQGLRRVDPLAVEQDHAVRAADAEAPAVLAERGRGARDDLRRIGVAHAGEDAELVAAHAVGGAVAGDRLREAAAEALEQHVAGDVAEGVVVGLEAVEVVEREHLRDAAGRGVLEVERERAAVAEAGERVGRRLALAALQHPQVRAEREHEARDADEQRRRRQPHGELVRPRVVVDQQEPERGERGAGGQQEHRPAAEHRPRVDGRRRLPGRERDEEVAPPASRGRGSRTRRRCRAPPGRGRSCRRPRRRRSRRR